MNDFANTNEEKEYTIERYQELRIIVGDDPIEVTVWFLFYFKCQLKSDKAEIFGIELIPDVTYKFVDTKVLFISHYTFF